MSDEEDTDQNGVFKRKTPKDRKKEVADLIKKLDRRHKEKEEKEERPLMKVKRVLSDSPLKELV